MLRDMKNISRLIHRNDPYRGFDAGAYPQDMQGWGANHHFFRKVIETTRPAVIFEVGTWKGASAINMANIARELNLDVEIVYLLIPAE